MVCSNVRIFVLTKTNNMKTQTTHNTQARVLITIAIFMGIFITGASIQILSNL